MKREMDKNSRQKDWYKAWQRDYYERTVGASQHKAWINKQYGITPEDYRRMMDEQEGKCALCNEECSGNRLSVDQNHDTGKVRGLLCRNCSRGLGLLKEDPSILLRAIQYLGKYADA